MGVPPLEVDADVRSLPHGTRVGAWRLKGGEGIGAYGAVYRAERVGHEEEGEGAVKLAILPRDPRFKREAELLRRISHPSVPQLLDSGDDVFPLGVMAYRLVTDEYPPFTDASMEEGKCWQPGGSGPLPPQDLNPRVSPELNAVIRRRRSREVVRVAVEADAAKRAEAERQQTEALAKATARVERDSLREQDLSWLPLLAATAVAALLLWLQQRELVRPQTESSVVQAEPAEEQRDGGVTYVGDTALSSAHSFTQPPMGKGVAVEAPPKPLPGQLKPDANGRCRRGQYLINGGYWLKVEVSDLEDCKGVRNGIEFGQACYAPIFPPTREPTSAPVKPAEHER